MKDQRDLDRNAQEISSTEKPLWFLLLAGLNVGIVLYMILIASGLPPQQQQAWVISLLMWFGLDGVFISSAVALMTHVYIPSLIFGSLRNVRLRLLDIVNHYNADLERYKVAAVGAYPIPHSTYNAAAHMSVAFRIARRFPDVREGDFVMYYKSPMPVLADAYNIAPVLSNPTGAASSVEPTNSSVNSSTPKATSSSSADCIHANPSNNNVAINRRRSFAGRQIAGGQKNCGAVFWGGFQQLLANKLLKSSLIKQDVMIESFATALFCGVIFATWQLFEINLAYAALPAVSILCFYLYGVIIWWSFRRSSILPTNISAGHEVDYISSEREHVEEIERQRKVRVKEAERAKREKERVLKEKAKQRKENGGWRKAGFRADQIVDTSSEDEIEDPYDGQPGPKLDIAFMLPVLSGLDDNPTSTILSLNKIQKKVDPDFEGLKILFPSSDASELATGAAGENTSSDVTASSGGKEEEATSAQSRTALEESMFSSIYDDHNMAVSTQWVQSVVSKTNEIMKAEKIKRSYTD